MKRFLKSSSLLLILVCVFVLSSCSNDPNAPVAPSQEDQLLLSDVMTDMSGSGTVPSPLSLGLLAKIATATPQESFTSPDGSITAVSTYNYEDLSAAFNLAYKDFSVGEAGKVNGSFNFLADSFSAYLYGRLQVKGYSSELDGIYVLEMYMANLQSPDGTSGTPDLTITHDGKDLLGQGASFEVYLPLIAELYVGTSNAVISDYKLEGDGLSLILKAHLDMDILSDLPSISLKVDTLSISIEGFYTREDGRTYSLYLEGGCDFSISMKATAQGEIRSVLSGTVSLKSALLKLDTKTISIDGFTVDMGRLDNDKYLENLSNSIRLKIDGQVIDLDAMMAQ